MDPAVSYASEAQREMVERILRAMATGRAKYPVDESFHEPVWVRLEADGIHVGNDFSYMVVSEDGQDVCHQELALHLPPDLVELWLIGELPPGVSPEQARDLERRLDLARATADLCLSRRRHRQRHGR
jgi:hypothetical protein